MGSERGGFLTESIATRFFHLPFGSMASKSYSMCHLSSEENHPCPDMGSLSLEAAFSFFTLGDEWFISL